MEDGGTGGDNYSDCHSDKLGNGIVHAMRNENRKRGCDGHTLSLYYIIMITRACVRTTAGSPSASSVIAILNGCQSVASTPQPYDRHRHDCC